MTHTIAKTSDGYPVIVSNSIKGSDGVPVVVSDDVKESDGTPHTIFSADALPTVPIVEFVVTAEREFIV